MSLYKVAIRPFARRMDLDKASVLCLRYFTLIDKLPFGRRLSRMFHGRHTVQSRKVFDISFCNPVGLGAGLDLRGQLYNELNSLGFSFVEIGPMGAKGIVRAIRKLQQDPPQSTVAVCINSDHYTAFSLGYDFFDFFVLDMGRDPLDFALTDAIIESRIAEKDYKSIILKYPERITPEALDKAVDYCLYSGIDGIELRNIRQIERAAARAAGRLPIIANCHIDSPIEAARALGSGASLIEIRKGFVREGPGIIDKILDFISEEDDK